MKFLLLNITLLAGMYCNCEYSRCAGCCKNCCGNGDNKNENNNNELMEDNKNENILVNNNNQLLKLNNNDIKNEINEYNNDKNEQEDTKENEEHNVLYFKIEGEAIDNNELECFGKYWFDDYNKIKNNAILLYGLAEQNNKQEAGTLVCSKGSKKLEYQKGDDFPKDLKDSDNKWAIFKVTTLNDGEKAGNSHIFYCSDVSSLNSNGLFEAIECWSIEILAANTQRVEDFCNMFKETKSYLEQDTKKPGASGFIGLEELDLSGANNLAAMFRMALFKQKTINSLSELRLQDNANIRQMFYVDKNNFVDENGPDFSVLNRWIKGNGVQFGYRYDIFFQGDYNAQDNDKLPEWCDDKKKKES